MFHLFTILSAVILLQASGFDAATLPLSSLANFNQSGAYSAPSNTTIIPAPELFPVPGTNVQLAFMSGGDEVPQPDLLMALGDGLATARHRIAEFGAGAPMRGGIGHYQYGRARVTIADVEPNSMTWADLRATLTGIWLFTAPNDFLSRSFRISNDGGWVGFGRFYELPTTPLAGASQLSDTA